MMDCKDRMNLGMAFALYTIALFGFMCPVPAVTAQDKPQAYQVGYAMGVRYGSALKQDLKGEVDFDAVIAGIEDALADKALAYSDRHMTQVLAEFQQQRFVKRKAQEQKMADDNKQEGQAFLEANAKKAGVVTLENGLQYKALVVGDVNGKKPTAQDRVKVHYQGTLIDGTVFDSSVERGEPATFPVSGVIQGWTQALQLMSVGAKWQLVIPPELGYGSRGTPNGPIGPNQTLIFEVELLAIES